MAKDHHLRPYRASYLYRCSYRPYLVSSEFLVAIYLFVPSYEVYHIYPISDSYHTRPLLGHLAIPPF